MIIGIAGAKRAGKDTAANWFASEHGFKKVGFADPLKDAFCTLTGLNRIELELLKNDLTAHLGVGYINNPTEAPKGVDVSFAEQFDGSVRMWSPVVDPITVRHALQRFGTEVGRNMFDDDFWIRMLDDRIGVKDGNWVISDVRFHNECTYVRSCGGKVFRVNRELADEDRHASENRLPDEYIDFEVDNNGTLVELYQELNELTGGLL